MLSVSSLTHSPLHSEYPALQANVHALPWHCAVALATLVVQALPHPPQFAPFVLVSTQVPPQSRGVDAGHTDTHVEAEHAGVPLGQATPQLAQLPGSLVKSTHLSPHRV